MFDVKHKLISPRIERKSTLYVKNFAQVQAFRKKNMAIHDSVLAAWQHCHHIFLYCVLYQFLTIALHQKLEILQCELLKAATNLNPADAQTWDPLPWLQVLHFTTLPACCQVSHSTLGQSAPNGVIWSSKRKKSYQQKKD